MSRSNLIVDPAQPVELAHPLMSSVINRFKCLPYGINSRGDTWRGSIYKSGNNGTLINGSTWERGRHGCGSLRFDGTNDYVAIPDSANLNPAYITLAAWVWLPVTPGNSVGCIVEKQASYGMRWINAKLNFVADPTGGAYNFSNAQSTTDVPIQQWSHCCITYDGTTVRYYLNGKPDGEATNHNGALEVIAGDLRFSRDSNALYAAEDLDDVLIYSRALFALEVAALCEATSRHDDPTLRWMSHRAYLLPAGGPATYTASVTATVGAATASATAQHVKPTYTASVAATIGAPTASVSATFTKPTYTATVAASVGAAVSSVSATFAKPTYTAVVTASAGAAVASASATFVKPSYTATVSAAVGPATASVSATFVKPTYTATISALVGAATAIVVASHFMATVHTASISASVGAATASATATFSNFVPVSGFICVQAAYIFSPGAVEGEVFVPGAVQGQIGCGE